MRRGRRGARNLCGEPEAAHAFALRVARGKIRSYRYSGWPLKVTCFEPSSRLMSANAPVAPAGAVTLAAVVVSGDHVPAHAPLQLLLPLLGVSLLKV